MLQSTKNEMLSLLKFESFNFLAIDKLLRVIFIYSYLNFCLMFSSHNNNVTFEIRRSIF